MADKNKRTGLIVAAVIIAIIIAIAGIIYISGSSGRALKKQLDLGHKYLIEQNYEQAILCFKKAIEIDPMCEDAYLSMADAYVGIDDFDSAISSLEEAIKLFESNGLDAIALQDKLVKIRAEKERIEEEKVAEDERKRIAELPYIEIQPILDCLDNLWGRKWTDWTMEDYIKEFNLEYYTNDGKEWWEEKDTPNYFHRVSLYENYFELDQSGKWIDLGDGCKTCHGGLVSLNFWENAVECRQIIDSDEDKDAKVIKDYLYNYASKNGIVSVETAKRFWGVENDCDVNTDLGLGKVRCYKELDCERIDIEVDEYLIAVDKLYYYDAGGKYEDTVMFVVMHR